VSGTRFDLMVKLVKPAKQLKGRFATDGLLIRLATGVKRPVCPRLGSLAMLGINSSHIGLRSGTECLSGPFGGRFSGTTVVQPVKGLMRIDANIAKNR